MGLVKRTYVDGETVITADNLNDIQDEIIQNASDISTKGTYSKPSGGIPSTDMTTEVQTSLGKADSAYQKPSGGIPSTDLASGVQTSLGKADTAYQKPSGGIPSTDLASAVQTSLGKADTALQSSDIDNTLTVSGKAADAKKTGDEISGVKNTLDILEDEVIISDTQPTEPNNKLWVKESSSSDGISIPTMDDIDDIEDDIGTIENTLNQLDADKAEKTDLVGNIILSGVNTTGQTITKGTYFYNNGELVRAIADISGSPAGTITAQNTETVTAGGLNDLKNSIIIETQEIDVSGYDGTLRESYVTATLKAGYKGYVLMLEPSTYNSTYYIRYYGGMNQVNGKIYFEHNLSSYVTKMMVTILWMK